MFSEGKPGYMLKKKEKHKTILVVVQEIRLNHGLCVANFFFFLRQDGQIGQSPGSPVSGSHCGGIIGFCHHSWPML